MAHPHLRGLRRSRGIHFAGHRGSCAHEIVVIVVRELQGWLSRQEAFRPIGLYLNNKYLDLFHIKGVQWSFAVERFICARLASKPHAKAARALAESPMYDAPQWQECNAIYQRLVSDGTFFQKTFTQVVQEMQPAECHALAKKLGEKAGAFDLERLSRQVLWETSRYLVRNRAVVFQGPVVQPTQTPPKRPRKPRGRTPDPEVAVRERRMTEAWDTGHYRTYAELAREFEVDPSYAGKVIRKHLLKQRGGKHSSR
jgi:hypothetical protein